MRHEHHSRVEYCSGLKGIRKFLKIMILAAAVLLTAGFTQTEGSDISGQLLTAVENHGDPVTGIVLVKDGRVILKQFYGSYPKGATGAAVNADSSLLRMASVSKVFTALLILELTDKGITDLDRDINEWLHPPVLRETWDKPVTLRHLLTHTGGFDDRYIGKSVRNRSDIIDLETTVRTMMPARILAPGEVYSYSNFGVALAGLAAEKAADKEFNALITEKIFEPLGMYRSSYDIPLQQVSYVVMGFENTGRGREPVPYDWILDVPAGQMTSSLSDMGRFLEFVTSPERQDPYLSGLYEAFLRASETQFTHHPALQGSSGFILHRMNFFGLTAVGHDGGYAGTNTRLLIFPDIHAGLFIAVNELNASLLEQCSGILIQYILPSAPPANAENIDEAAAEQPSAEYREGVGDLPLEAFTGTYRVTRYARHEFTKIGILMGFLGHEMVIGLDGPYLTMPDHTGKIRRLARADSLLFRSIDDDYAMAFRREGDGITHVFTSGTSAMEKVPFFWTVAVQSKLLITCSTLFFIFFWFFAVRSILTILKNRRANADGGTTGHRLSAADRLGWTVSALYTVQPLLIAAGYLTLPAGQLSSGFPYGLPVIIRAAFLLPPIAIGLTLWLLLLLISSRIKNRIFPAVFTILSLLYAVCLHYWQLF